MCVILIALCLGAMVMVPMASAVEKNITLNITSPEEDDILYNDVAPAFILVQGSIDAPRGIRNVSISNWFK